MKSTDIEVLGAVADLVTYPPHWERITPPLETEELEHFITAYYERCLRENPQGEWANSRYEAAWDIANWFKAVPPDENVESQTFLLHMKDWMTAVFLKSDDEIRQAIITGALEHILEEKRWRIVFSDWQNNPELNHAYQQAMEWAVEHESQ